MLFNVSEEERKMILRLRKLDDRGKYDVMLYSNEYFDKYSQYILEQKQTPHLKLVAN